MSDQFLSDGAPSIRITKVLDTFGPAAPGQTTAAKDVYFIVNGLPETHVTVQVSANWVEEARSAVIQHAADLLELMNTRFN